LEGKACLVGNNLIVEHSDRFVNTTPGNALSGLAAEKKTTRLGVCQTIRGGIEDFTCAIEIDPEYAGIFYFRGLEHPGMGDIVLADADFAMYSKLIGDVLKSRIDVFRSRRGEASGLHRCSRGAACCAPAQEIMANA